MAEEDEYCLGKEIAITYMQFDNVSCNAI